MFEFYFWFFIVSLIFIIWFFLFRLVREDFYEYYSPDSKDFKIGDPVAWLSADHKSIRYTYINWFDTFCSQFILETGDYSWSSVLRHPTPEELEKYFRK